MGHKLRKLEKEAMRNIPEANNDNGEHSGLRMRIVRTEENDVLRVQDISENTLNHENVANDISRVQMNHPYVDRVVGVRPTPVVEEEPQNNVVQEEISVKNKECAECGKQFVNGTKRKSKYLACISCDRLTHEKCGEKKTPFRCVHCKDLNTSDINENIEDGALSDVLDDIPVIIAGHEDLHEEV